MSINIPLQALSWMVLNEVEQSTERLPELACAQPDDARSELLDVIAAVDWLEGRGVDVTEHRDAMLHDEWVARILAKEA